jgi:hypothetical protein
MEVVYKGMLMSGPGLQETGVGRAVISEVIDREGRPRPTLRRGLSDVSDRSILK